MSILKRNARITLQNCFDWQRTTSTGPHDQKAKKNNMQHQLNAAIVGKILRAAENQQQYLSDCLHVIYNTSCDSKKHIRFAAHVWERFIADSNAQPRQSARLMFALPMVMQSCSYMLRGSDRRFSDADLCRAMGYDDYANANYAKQYAPHVDTLRKIICGTEERAIAGVVQIVSDAWRMTDSADDDVKSAWAKRAS